MLCAQLLFAGRRLTEGRVAEVRPAADRDLSVVRLLLEQAGLPTSDLATSKPEFTVLWDDGRIVGAGALELYGSAALARSVVVATDRRGAGLGGIIMQELEKVARGARIGRLILLTQTAAEFFARHGYRIIGRNEVPQDIQGSEEFRSLCPAAAICMGKVVSDSR